MEIDRSLVKTIGESGVIDMLSDLGEITLNSVIENGFIDKIPIIGTLKNIYKISNSISDHLFVQKILKFLKELDSLSQEEKQKMKSKIELEENNRIGETLLEIINKIDDNNKLKIIAKIFAAYINEEIFFHEFQRFCQMVNRCYLPHLYRLTEFYMGQPITNEYSGSLLSMGLIHLSEKKYSADLDRITDYEMFEYKLNNDGKKLLYILYPQFEVIY